MNAARKESVKPWTIFVPSPQNVWNQSIETRNLALFYDGSVAEFGIEETLVAEDAVGADFWLRNTPLGQLGVYGEFAQGGLTSSAHFLTTFGIRGRDRIDE